MVKDVSRAADTAFGDVWVPYTTDRILMTNTSSENMAGWFSTCLLAKDSRDFEAIRHELLKHKAEIASRRKEEKRGVKSTTIKVRDEKTGEVVEKNISASEMNKRRLEYARQQDAERYKDERTVPLSELQNKKED